MRPIYSKLNQRAVWYHIKQSIYSLFTFFLQLINNKFYDKNNLLYIDNLLTNLEQSDNNCNLENFLYWQFNLFWENALIIEHIYSYQWSNIDL